MKQPKDRFSVQAETYKKYRPTYPPELYAEVLRLTPARKACWDCATGNGQVAWELSNHFEKVFATDISQNQLAQAPKKENILYSVAPAEATSFAENQFNLVTVAQALHWFDFEKFNTEVLRVTINGGLLATWGYGLLTIDKHTNILVEQFYSDIVGSYWDAERNYIETAYSTIPFPFQEIKFQNPYAIQTQWSLNDLEGYFNSWSAVQNYIAATTENPVPWIIERLQKHWSKDQKKEIKFPLFTRIGQIKK